MDLIGTAAGNPAPRAPAAWVSVIGIVVLVFGALATLGGLLGVVFVLLLGMLAGLKEQNPDMRAVGLDQMVEHRTLMFVFACLTILLGLVQVAGAIKTLRRARVGATLMVSWAWAKIALVLISQVVSMPLNAASVEAQSASTGGMFPESLMSAIMYASVVFGVLWGVALPVFVLIWFRRASVRAEVDTWTPARDMSRVGEKDPNALSW